MNVKRLAVVVGLAVSALAVAPPAGAATPSIALGDIAGFTATPGGQVTQVSLTVSVPTAATSADCNTPGTFEYALFGFSFSADTFAGSTRPVATPATLPTSSTSRWPARSRSACRSQASWSR